MYSLAVGGQFWLVHYIAIAFLSLFVRPLREVVLYIAKSTDQRVWEPSSCTTVYGPT